MINHSFAGSFPGLRGRSVELPAYSGPLDLLLQLIRKNEVDIYNIPIASITEQYLAELERLESRDLFVAGDFLLMAATLIEIKSAMILPRPPVPEGEEESGDPRAELVQHLLEYQAFQAVAEELSQLESQRRLVHGRPFLPSTLKEYGPLYPPVRNLNMDTLCQSLRSLLERLEARDESITSLPRQKVSLRLRIAEVAASLGLLGERGCTLEEMMELHRGRLFVIVTFLALLELIRAGKILVEEIGGVFHFRMARPGAETPH